MSSTPSHTRMSAAQVVLMLSLLMGIQPVTTDLYLPALPGLTQDLAATMAQAQLTLTALLLAFGASQLVWGPVSDRFGRKPVLLAGMLAYLLASVGSALSSSMETLIVWRTLQGVAMGAGVMGARAVVRDLYAPLQGATVMSKALSGLGVIACLSAPVGGALTSLWGWHAALMTLAVFGACTLVLIALRFEETLVQKNPHALQWKRMLGTWWQILRTPQFVAFSALSMASYGGLFTYLAASSFVYIRVLGFSATQYGLTMFLNSFVYLLGTFACRRLVARFGVRRRPTVNQQGDPFPVNLGNVTQALPAHAGAVQVMPVLQQGIKAISILRLHEPEGHFAKVITFRRSFLFCHASDLPEPKTEV